MRKNPSEIVNVKRKFAHILGGVFYVVLIYFNFFYLEIMLFNLVFSLVTPLLHRKTNLKLIKWFLRNFELNRNLKKFPAGGVFFYTLGSLIVALFFQKEIAMAAILILAVGDAFSDIIGRNGKIKCSLDPKKNLEGIFAGIIFSSLVAWIFVPLIFAFTASFIAMLFELTGIKVGKFKLDDNLYIPIIGALVLQILFWI